MLVKPSWKVRSVVLQSSSFKKILFDIPEYLCLCESTGHIHLVEVSCLVVVFFSI